MGKMQRLGGGNIFYSDVPLVVLSKSRYGLNQTTEHASAHLSKEVSHLPSHPTGPSPYNIPQEWGANGNNLLNFFSAPCRCRTPLRCAMKTPSNFFLSTACAPSIHPTPRFSPRRISPLPPSSPPLQNLGRPPCREDTIAGEVSLPLPLAKDRCNPTWRAFTAEARRLRLI